MIRYSVIEGNLPSDASAFTKATPFEHVVLENLIEPQELEQLIKDFPDDNWDGWDDINHEHQKLKLACACTENMPEKHLRAIQALTSARFLKYLSNLTGIKNLLPDPFLIGGGLHLTRPGGTLTPHIDFHTSKDLPLYRRLNLILYLSDGWQKADGGELELWQQNPKKIAKTVEPISGRMLIFRTDTKSLHGFTNPVERQNRQSIALYYYTVEEADSFAGDSRTYWHSTPVARSKKSYVRLTAEKLLLGLAKIFSGFAWRLEKAADRFRGK